MRVNAPETFMPYGSDKLFLLNGKIETFFAGEKKHLPRKMICLNHGYDVINIAAYKNNHVCIVRKLTVSQGTRTKINSGFLPLALSLYHADIPVSTGVSALFSVCFTWEA